MTEEMKAELKKYITGEIIARTEKARPKKAVKMTPQEEMLQEIFSPGGWDSENTRRKMLNAARVMTKLEIPEIDMDGMRGWRVKGVAVVPKINANGHNYPLEKVCVIYSDGADYALMKDGTAGNSLTWRHGALRLATDDEILEFVESMGDAWLNLLRII